MRTLFPEPPPSAAAEPPSVQTIREQTRKRLFQVVIGLGLLLSSAEAVLALLDARYVLGAMLGGLALALAISVLMLRDVRRLTLAADVGNGAAFVFFLGGLVYVLQTGDNLYLVWGPVYIPIAYSLQGRRRGFYWVIAFLVTQLAIYGGFYFTGRVVLPFAYFRELVLAFMAFFILVAAYELLREYYEGLLESMNDRLSRLATTDQLTGTFNRRMMETLLLRELSRSQREARGMSVILCDIDHFKKVNDTFGHQVGDAVLRRFAAVLRDNTRQMDFIARWGGEEFLILCPGAGPGEARTIAERIRGAIERATFPDVERLTASFGVAALDSGAELDELLRRADEALYKVKQSTRNAVQEG